jgi:rhodanese-related sulfurtransferase
MAAHAPGFLKIVDDAKQRVREITIAETRERVSGAAKAAPVLVKGAVKAAPVLVKGAVKAAPVLIDVREDSEWAAGHAVGAIHIGKGVIERDIEAKVPAKDTEIILYCGGGFRSALAGDALQQMGYTNVWSMAGGWREWVAAGAPTETP